jgi:ribonucleoside-diphosphate reductase alpha chain
VKKISTEWVRPGHRYGDNTHNVSATISIDKNSTYMKLNPGEDRFCGDNYHNIDEWQKVGEWMWNNREVYNGLSVLPYSEHSYVQAPFETITEEQYNERVKHLSSIDLTKVIELDDATDLKGEAACSAGGCVI